MERQIASLSSDELIALYHKTNTELTKNLLNGAAWQEQQERINLLTEISKIFTKRKVEIQADHNVERLVR